MLKLGEKLRDLRLSLGLTQEQVGRVFGRKYGQRLVSVLERRDNIETDTLFAYVKSLDGKAKVVIVMSDGREVRIR